MESHPNGVFKYMPPFLAYITPIMAHHYNLGAISLLLFIYFILINSKIEEDFIHLGPQVQSLFNGVIQSGGFMALTFSIN